MGKIRKYIAAARIERGRVRTNNEDALFVEGKLLPHREVLPACESIRFGRGLFAVFDGMGGEEKGEDASHTAASLLAGYHSSILSAEGRTGSVEAYINSANGVLRDICREQQIQMGTTIAMLCIDGDSAWIYNAGDSRVYLLRGGKLLPVTQDHTTVRELAAAGAVHPKNASKTRVRDALTLYLGKPSPGDRLRIYQNGPIEIREGDRFLLCSDGLTGMLDEQSIARELSADSAACTIADRLTSLALQMGGRDNLSVVVIKEFTVRDLEHLRVYCSCFASRTEVVQADTDDPMFYSCSDVPEKNLLFERVRRVLSYSPDVCMAAAAAAGIWCLYRLVAGTLGMNAF